jgi:hypothetical protein
MIGNWLQYQGRESSDEVSYKGLRARKGYNRLLKDIACVEPLWGSEITDSIKEMVFRSDYFGIRTYMYFNDVYLICNPGDSVESLVETYHRELDENSQKYRRTFRYLLSQREMVERRKDNERRREIVQGWMKEDKMKIKLFKVFKYWKAKKINESDSYSNHVITYAHEWAVGMQRAMQEGKEISEVANEMGRFVDYDGITGFMHGCAASFIAHFWKHGEEFRQWFNLHHQIGDEGERANKEKGAVLNPAILTIGGD